MGVFPQPPEDVFDVDDRIVHEFADRHRKAAERHRVDRHSQPLEDQAGDHDRERNRRQRDERRAEVEQKQKQDHDHEDAAIPEGLDDIPDAQVDERLLLVEPRIETDVGRERGPQFLQCPGDIVGESSRVGAGLLGDHQNHRRPAVDGRIAALDLGRLLHPGHLPKDDRPPTRRLDDHRHEIAHALDPAERTDQELVAPLVEIAAGGVGIAGLHRGLHLPERESILEQRFRVHEHLKLLPAAPHRHDLSHAGNGEQPLPHHPVGQRSDLDRRRGVVFTRDANMHHLPHDRGNGAQLRADAHRHSIERNRDLLGDDLPVDVDVGAPSKLDGDHRQADAG